MNAEIGVVLNRLPVQPAVRVEREAAAAALVTGVGRARRVPSAFVWGSETLVSLSQERTGLIAGKTASDGISAARVKLTAPASAVNRMARLIRG